MAESPDKRTEENRSGSPQISRRSMLTTLGAGIAGMAALSVSAGWVSADTANPAVPSPCLTSTITNLRKESNKPLSDFYYVTDEGQEGFFSADPSDTVSPDNSGTIIVAGNGTRYKRRYEGPINVRWFGAKGDGTNDDAGALQAALDEAARLGGQEVYIPAGTYSLSRTLFIFKNTTLTLDDHAELIRNHGGNILMNYRVSDKFGGYNGNSNITIQGGIFNGNGANQQHVSSGLAFAHSENITIRKTSLLDIPKGHAIELTGDRNVLISEVQFLGFIGDSTHYYVEAIQLEPCTRDGFSGYEKDDTATHNVTVTNCYFGNSASAGAVPWPAGVGSHSSAYQAWCDKISVSCNRFEGMTYWAIRAFKWSNSVISGNILRDVKGGIYVCTAGAGSLSSADVNQIPQPPQPAYNIAISGNVIESASGTGILVEGVTEAKSTSVVVSENVLKNCKGHMIEFSSADFCIAANNNLDTGQSNGFIIINTTNSEFTNNQIRNINYYGFNTGKDNDAVSILHNKIINVSQTGENRYDGIMLNNHCTNFRIIGNVVKTEAGKFKPRYGLNIDNTCSGTIRFGNDFRCNAVSGNIEDLQAEGSNTSTIDLE